MFDSIAKLFSVPGFARHFAILSIVYLILPTLIFRFFEPHSNEWMLHGYKWCTHALTSVLNFDGIHYFNNNYDYEPNHAFLPLYVRFVQFVKEQLGPTIAIGVLVIINKIAFVAAAADLHLILKNLEFGQEVRMQSRETDVV
jgi:hypothetical protein